MRSAHLVVYFIVISVSSCTWGIPHNPKKAIAKDTLSYTYKTFKERGPDCGNKPDSACTVINLKYPIFKGQKTLNDTVNSQLTSTFKIDDKSDYTITALAKHFMDFYHKDVASGHATDMAYDLDIDESVIRQDSDLTTLQLKGYIYLGGAHGGSLITFTNWNTKANRKIALTDILIPGYQEKLRREGEKIFRKNERLSDTASLADGYFFKDNKFALNDNYLITPLGIRFLYNEYEIKPYAAGATDLFIPYTQIKSLLRPNTVVSQYIK
jgi:hypothetical protein